jgi:hypothetical protein
MKGKGDKECDAVCEYDVEAWGPTGSQYSAKHKVSLSVMEMYRMRQTLFSYTSLLRLRHDGITILIKEAGTGTFNVSIKL